VGTDVGVGGFPGNPSEFIDADAQGGGGIIEAICQDIVVAIGGYYVIAIGIAQGDLGSRVRTNDWSVILSGGESITLGGISEPHGDCMGAQLSAGGIPFDDACFSIDNHAFGGIIQAPDEGIVIEIRTRELVAVCFI
jgi:hypothetical protein